MEMMSIRRRLFDLDYECEGQWVGLPEWARFYLLLGFTLAAAEVGEQRFVMGLTLPVRDYAAAFVATGVVAGRSVVEGGKDRVQAHFEELAKLPVGTPVLYRQNDRILQGVFEGVGMAVGCKDLQIKVRLSSRRNGSLTHYLTAKQALMVEPGGRIPEGGDLPGDQHGRQVRAREEFIAACLGDEAVLPFISLSRLDSVIVGYKSKLRQEVGETSFAAGVKKPDVCGHLEDLLRARELLGVHQAYRSSIQAVASEPDTEGEEDPAVVVFDGAAGFLKWRRRWRQSHWVVLMDRTESLFHEGCDALNAEYRKYKQKDLRLHAGKDAVPVPEGVEFVAFTEEVR